MNPIIRVFKLFGTLDNLEGKQLCQEVNESLKKNVNVVLIDLQNVTFMDSSGLAALASVRKNVLAAGGKLFLCSISDPVKILLELTSTDQVFEICATRDELLG
jgi:anti-anti-sigma factor